MKLYKVLMFGARDWTDPVPIVEELKRLIEEHGVSNLLVIEGGADGADELAGRYATDWNIHTARVPALWKTRGRGAGPQRNAIMAALEPDEAIGFHENLFASKGTADMARRLDKAGIPYRILGGGS